MKDTRQREQDDVSSLSWVQMNVDGTDNTITKQRALLTKQLIKHPSLDAGCNTAGYTIFTGCTVGVDWVTEHLTKAKADGLANCVCCCAEFLPFRNGTFQTVVATELIEHVDKPDELLSELCRVGHQLIITTPLDPVDADGHVRLYTTKTLLQQLSKHIKVTNRKVLREKGNIRMAFVCGVCRVRDTD